MAPPNLLPHLMGVLDCMDRETLRTQLTQATENFCERQDYPASPAVITQAVAEHLASAPSTPCAQFDFGWDRPTDETKRQALLAKYSVALKLFNGPTRWNFVAGFSGSAAAGGLAWLITSSLGLSVSILISSILILPPLSDAAARFFLRWRKVSQTMDVKLTARQLEKWAKWPNSRAYIRACLDSPVPTILNGDELVVETMVNHHLDAARAAREKEDQDRVTGNLRRLFCEETTDIRKANPG